MAAILITGAARGIGLALTRQFAARGDRVIAVCRSPSSELQQIEGVRIIADIEELAGSGAEAGCSASWICPATISAVPIASGTVAGTRKPGAFLSRKVAYIHIAMIPTSGDQPPSRRLKTLSGCST